MIVSICMRYDYKEGRIHCDIDSDGDILSRARISWMDACGRFRGKRPVNSTT